MNRCQALGAVAVARLALARGVLARDRRDAAAAAGALASPPRPGSRVEPGHADGEGADPRRRLHEGALRRPGFVELGPIAGRTGALRPSVRRNTHGRDACSRATTTCSAPSSSDASSRTDIWLTDSTQPLDSQALEWTMTGMQARDWMGVRGDPQAGHHQGTDAALDERRRHHHRPSRVLRRRGGQGAASGSGPADLQKLPTPSASRGRAQTLRTERRAAKRRRTSPRCAP